MAQLCAIPLLFASSAAVAGHPNVNVVRDRINALTDYLSIKATGALTGSKLAEAIAAETAAERWLLRRDRAHRPPREH